MITRSVHMLSNINKNTEYYFLICRAILTTYNHCIHVKIQSIHVYNCKVNDQENIKIKQKLNFNATSKHWEVILTIAMYVKFRIETRVIINRRSNTRRKALYRK